MPKVLRSVVVAVEAIASKSRYHHAERGAAMEKVRRRARVTRQVAVLLYSRTIPIRYPLVEWGVHQAEVIGERRIQGLDTIVAVPILHHV
jgi:hypothetical protein